MDLRNNGGGSLAEAIELTGLFIDKGPVVQVRESERPGRGRRATTQPGVAWDGPLAVLINRGSASASEIFAAAIQDYGRGLIIGEPTFGKGTVQNLVDLDRLLAASDKPQYGELKMTIAEFFRINGGTTQLRGVTPDIAFPVNGDDEGLRRIDLRQRAAVDADRAGRLQGGGRPQAYLPQLLQQARCTAWRSRRRGS